MAILRACVRCGRLSEATLCPAHRKKKDKQPSAAKRGYDHKWRKTRARYLRQNPWCVECGTKATDVDHIDGLGPKGPAGHDFSNLRSFCHSCHAKRTARDQRVQKRWGDDIVILVGPSGVGKSSVRAELAPRLGYTSLGPDDFMGRWHTLFIRLDAVPHAVVECVRINKALRERMRYRKATVVELTAPLITLARHMEERGESRATVEKRLGEGQGYKADLTVDTTDRTPADVAREIAERVR